MGEKTVATLIVAVDEVLHLQTEDGQVVVSSRYVAERFGKRHDNVIRDIEGILKIEETSKSYFIPSKYQHPQNKQWYPEYLLTRDGFTLLAMGFTGQEALEWKLKYIQAFNKMEAYIKEQQALPQNLSPQLQLLINMELEQKKIKEQLTQANTVAIEAKATAEQATKQIEAVRDTMLLDHDSWRKDCNNLLNNMAKERGATKEAYKEVREEAYKLTEQRAGASLKQRVVNKQDRLRREGICKSKVDKICSIDVIADDKRLKEIYIAVIKDMAFKYGVN